MDRDKLKALLKHCEDYNSKYDGEPLDINKLADYLIANGIGDITALKAENERLKTALQGACDTIENANSHIFDEPYPCDINYYLGGNADD